MRRIDSLAIAPLITWRRHAPPSLLYRATYHREAQAARACVTCGRCSARRHWQQAASDDAHACPAWRRDKLPQYEHRAALAGAGPLLASCDCACAMTHAQTRITAGQAGWRCNQGAYAPGTYGR